MSFDLNEILTWDTQSIFYRNASQIPGVLLELSEVRNFKLHEFEKQPYLSDVFEISEDSKYEYELREIYYICC